MLGKKTVIRRDTMTDYEVNRLKDKLEARDIIIDDYERQLKGKGRETYFWKFALIVSLIINSWFILGSVFQ